MSYSRLWGGSSLKIWVLVQICYPPSARAVVKHAKNRELTRTAAAAADRSDQPANVGILAMDMYFPKTYVRQVRYGSFGAFPRPRSLQLEAQQIACCVWSTRKCSSHRNEVRWFFPSQQLEDREGADVEKHCSERPRQELPSGPPFDVVNLPVAEESPREQSPHDSNTTIFDKLRRCWRRIRALLLLTVCACSTSGLRNHDVGEEKPPKCISNLHLAVFCTRVPTSTYQLYPGAPLSPDRVCPSSFD